MKSIDRNLRKIAILVSASLVLGVQSSCIKDVPSTNETPSTESYNKFNFSSKKTVDIKLQYDVKAGYPVEFELYSTSPLALDEFKSYVKNRELTPFLSGRTDNTGKVSFTGELPASVSEIYAYSTGIGVPVLMKASVSSTGSTSKFTPVTVTPKQMMSTRAVGDRASGTNSWLTYSISLAKPVLPAVSMTISESDKKLIDASFPENQDYDLVKTYYRSSIQLNKEARVKIYSVKHGATSERTNALAYFTYTKDSEQVKPEDVNSNLQLAFNSLNKSTLEGSGYQLLNNGNEIFEAGTKIGFALLPDVNPDQIETNNIHLLYSCYNTGSWNVYGYPKSGTDTGLERASAPHMVVSLLRVTADGHAIMAISFEDQPFSGTHGTNKGNFRDDIFILEIDPKDALPDDLPEPPTDEPEYDVEFASAGILCFEDNWPHIGDYDMNDVVLAYERAILYSYAKGTMGLREKFRFLNNGATFTNGFAYQMLGVSKSSITKCTLVSEDYQCEGQGLDVTAADNEAVITLFDNGKQIPLGATFEVNSVFALGNNFIAVNPFIVVHKNEVKDMFSQGRVEVHLPTADKSTLNNRFLPTSKMNTAFWGQYADRSQPEKNIYYVREGNYPFALDINWDASKDGSVSKFKIPTEGRSIDFSYPEFTKWVESSGKTNTDWFLRPSGL